MGKKRVAFVGEEQPVEEKQEELKNPQIPEEPQETPEVQEPVEETQQEAPVQEPEKEKKEHVSNSEGPTKPRVRGKKYAAARTKIDPTKSYTPTEAIELAKETSYSKFDGSLEVHLVTTKKGLKGEAKLPHLATKSRKVEVATKETLEKLDASKVDFDVLIAAPSFMPNLVKYAKLLGPKGLMPNPKNGTIVEDPEKVAASFTTEAFTYKTEPNAPLIHTAIGKTSQATEELEANFKALITAIGPKNVVSGVVKATMGPSVKISL